MSLKYPYGFVYEVTCKTTGRKYIGSHRRCQNDDDPDDEWYIGSSMNHEFWDDLEVYGKSDFVRVILEDVYIEDSEYLKSRESYYLKKVNARDNPMYYNLTVNSYGGGSTIGKKLVHKGDIDKFVSEDDLDKFINEGWSVGASVSRIESNSKSHIGKSNQKVIDLFIERLNTDNPMKYEEYRKKVSESKLGKVWVNKDGKQTYIDKKDLNEYLSKGYVEGMIKRVGSNISKSYMRICKVCNVSYKGGKYSVYCPECYSSLRSNIMKGVHSRWKE